jgi:hypothetical protein
MASGRTEYLNDPEAPKPNSLVPAAGVLAVDPGGRVLLQHHRDTASGRSLLLARTQEVPQSLDRHRDGR